MTAMTRGSAYRAQHTPPADDKRTTAHPPHAHINSSSTTRKLRGTEHSKVFNLYF